MRPLSCISLLFFHILWENVLIILRERREIFGYLVHRGSEREREKDCKWCVVELCISPLLNTYRKTSYGCSCLLGSEPHKISVYCVSLCYVYAYVYGKVIDMENA